MKIVRIAILMICAAIGLMGAPTAYAHYESVESIEQKAESIENDLARLSYLVNAVRSHRYKPFSDGLPVLLYKEAKAQHSRYYISLALAFLADRFYEHGQVDSLKMCVNELHGYVKYTKDYTFYLAKKAVLSEAYAQARRSEMAKRVADETLEESLKFHNYNGQVRAYGTLASYYRLLGKTNKMLENLKLAEEIINNHSTRIQPRVIAITFMRMAVTYGAMQDEANMLKYIERTEHVYDMNIKQFPSYNKNWDEMRIMCDLVQAQYYLSRQNYSKAQFFINESSKFFGPHIDVSVSADCDVLQVKLYQATKKYDDALQLIDKTLGTLTYKGSNYSDLMKIRVEVLRMLGRYKEAAQIAEMLVQKSDSLNGAYAHEQIKNIKDTYAISNLKYENQRVINDRNYYIIFIMAIALLVAVIVLLIANQFMRRARKMKKAMSAAALAAQESNMVKERLVMEISHEVRTPLTSVIGFAEELVSDESLDEKTRAQYSEIIQDNAAELVEYVDNVLELSGLESGKRTYKEEPVQVMDIIRKEVDDFNKCGYMQKAEIVTDIKDLTIITDRKYYSLLVRGILSKPVDSTEPVVFNLNVKDGMFNAVIKGSLLTCKSIIEDKVDIRNEINAHFLHHFGGYYEVDSVKDELRVGWQTDYNSEMGGVKFSFCKSFTRFLTDIYFR